MQLPWLRRQSKPGIDDDGFGAATKVGLPAWYRYDRTIFFSPVFVDLERGEAAAATASASPRLGGNVRSWSLPGGRRRRLPPGLVAWPASVKEQRCLPYPSSGAGSGLSGSGHLLLFPRKGDREGEERDASDAAMSPLNFSVVRPAVL